jgi:hypothetical protein
VRRYANILDSYAHGHGRPVHLVAEAAVLDAAARTSRRGRPGALLDVAVVDVAAAGGAGVDIRPRAGG